MVFVTVGTHEQPFDRLVGAIDSLAAEELSGERVVVQTGWSTLEPRRCEWKRLYPPERMAAYMREADVVVTHGGPSSFLEAIAAGKVPVVVPRQARYGEHVNDHQVEFVRFVEARGLPIVACYEVDALAEAIRRARVGSAGATYQGHNVEFCQDLAELIEGL